MKSSIAPPIGIDFGTTNSSMAWFNPEAGRDGRAEIIRGDNEGETMPSLVYFGEDGIEVGVAVENRIEDAKIYTESERQAELRRIVKSVKRDLGSRALIAFSEDQEARPVEVAAAILDKLRQDAEKNLFQQQVKRAVVTCPAVFTTQQRKKLLEAARLARLEEIELLDEPVAAAMAFVSEGYQVGDGVLVYDLGGGTFDLAFVVREADGSFRVAIEPDGDARCGGDDFDQALYDYFDRLAREKLGRSLCPAEGIVDLFYLLDCRKRKESLSFNESAAFKNYLASGPSGPVYFDARIERATFEGLIIEDVEKTVRKTAEMVRRAPLEGYKVDTVVLIGGSSKIPLIKKRLEQVLPVAPQNWMHHHLAVALGAAYHAQRLWQPSSKPHLPSLPPPDRNLDQYRIAVQSAWANKWLEEKALNDLFTLALQLGLNREQAAEVEVEVMGASKEQVWDRQKVLPPPHIDESSPPSPEAQGLLKEARQFLASGQLDTALQYAQSVCDLAPRWAEGFYLKAEIMQERRDYKLVGAAATKCLELAPDHQKAYSLRGWCRLLLGEAAGAKDDFDQCIRLEPSAEIYLSRAEAHQALGQTAMVVADLETALGYNADLTGWISACLPPRGAFETAMRYKVYIPELLRAIAGLLLVKKLNAPDQAVAHLSQVLNKCSAVVAEAYNQLFIWLCQHYGIQIQHSLLDEVQRALWLACRSLHDGSTRIAVAKFRRLNPHPPSPNVWQGDAEFAFHMASCAAEQGKGVEAAGWLGALLAVRPYFDIMRAKRDPAIKGCGEISLREFLKVKLTHSMLKGAVFNYLTITNRSRFCVTAVQAQIKVERTDGKSYVLTKTLDTLWAGRSHSWNDLFEDAGFFGNKIRAVNVSLTCAEMAD